ncbi:hypothetical protein [Effusibacillus consociatus]|uniref:Uncharacterized protein n=1 Tax=Effusibacillus consociatus TaxID=1117041 RepID=A0ABV9Q5G7_9BACL
MKHVFTLFFVLVLVSGCTSPKVEQAYQPPIAITESKTEKQVDPKVEKQVDSKNVAQSIWSGTWTRSLNSNGAILSISNENSTSFDFSIEASSGGNTGNIKGNAVKKGNTAIYESGDNCTITFNLIGETIKVDQNQGCLSHVGMGVTFSGTYQKGEEKEKKSDLVQLGVLKNHDQDQKFKELVGDDYNLFIERFQIISEPKNVDAFDATVKSGSVKGLYTVMEAIVMSDSKGKFWAALIDDKQVKYYTNDNSYKTKLPKTIEEWRQGFKNLPIIYMKK